MKWCFEPAPLYFRWHSCHLRSGHKGAHAANICGLGAKGGRKAEWTQTYLRVWGGGHGHECLFCKGERARIRVRLVEGTVALVASEGAA